MLELGLGVVLAAAAVWFVLRPVLRPETVEESAIADEGGDPDDDLSARAVALRGLKDVEFDRATGKLSDADYQSLRAKYTAEAVAALRAEGGEAGSRKGEAGGASPAVAPGYCGRCGAALQPDARFCNRCGGRVAP